MTEKKMRCIQVTTTNAFIDAELVRKELVVHKQSSISQEEGKPYIISSFEQQLEVKPQDALLVECQVFVAACNGELDPNLPGIDAGVESLRISQQIIEKIEK